MWMCRIFQFICHIGYPHFSPTCCVGSDCLLPEKRALGWQIKYEFPDQRVSWQHLGLDSWGCMCGLALRPIWIPRNWSPRPRKYHYLDWLSYMQNESQLNASFSRFEAVLILNAFFNVQLLKVKIIKFWMAKIPSKWLQWRALYQYKS